MGMKTPEQIEMLKHLEAVRALLTKHKAHHVQSLASGKPFANWTLEHTREYHTKQLESIEIALDVLFLETMRIDPD